MHKVIKPFDFFHDGITATHYEGECEIPEDALAVAQAEGWVEVKGKK